MLNSQEDINTEIAARLLKIRHEFNLSQKKLAQIVEASQSNVSSALAGKRGIPKVWIFKIISRYTKLNEDWIWTGNGEMLKYIPEEKKSGEMLVMEDMTKYSNGRQLKKDEMEKMLARMAFRIEELEEWRREMEEWKKEVLSHLMNK
jgi:predicted transcriptional regulator